MVAGSHKLILQVSPAPDEDAGELAVVTGRLRAELLDLDVKAVDPVSRSAVPECTKGVAAIAGWLAVHLGAETLKVVLGKVADWVTRNDRIVIVTIAADTLELHRATRQQQEEIINVWLARHSAGP